MRPAFSLEKPLVEHCSLCGASGMAIVDQCCMSRREVYLASQGSSTVIERPSTSDVLLVA
jgi:hypothetical protein